MYLLLKTEAAVYFYTNSGERCILSLLPIIIFTLYAYHISQIRYLDFNFAWKSFPSVNIHIIQCDAIRRHSFIIRINSISLSTRKAFKIYFIITYTYHRVDDSKWSPVKLDKKIDLCITCPYIAQYIRRDKGRFF